MMKLVNMLVSKTSAERLVGSSPTLGTKGNVAQVVEQRQITVRVGSSPIITLTKELYFR